MAHGLSKSRLMDWRQCPRKLWLRLNRSDLVEDSADTETRFRLGFEVGEKARELFPDGRLIDSFDPTEALEQTQHALEIDPRRTLFEAAFARDGVLVRVDVLRPEAGGYRLIEVKASTQVKDAQLSDIAIQRWVVQDSLTLTGTTLAHVDNQFVYRGADDYRGLLRLVAVETEIAGRLAEIPDWVAQARATLSGTEPSIEPGAHCQDPYDCPFQGHCAPVQPQPAYPLTDLPYLNGRRLQGLEALGMTEVGDIPEDYPLTERQRRIADVVRTGQVFCDPQAARVLERLGWPRYYLDFETLTCAVPPWVGTRPYQQLPVQWSCHVQWWPGSTAPSLYVFDGEEEPLRAFAETLIQAVCQPIDPARIRYPLEFSGPASITWECFPEWAASGSILVYNAAFEQRILRELAEALPDLAPELEAIGARIVDLLPIVREYYYHPDQHGSWSLKAVLPTMAPELSYDALVIGDGGEASDAWREILHPETPELRREELRRALIDYCLMDTWALVVIENYLRRAGAG